MWQGKNTNFFGTRPYVIVLFCHEHCTDGYIYLAAG